MIVFRADGNKKTGLGHIMRCLSVADAFASRGEECLFVVAESETGRLITRRGYECEVLSSSPFELECETGRFLSLLKNYDVKAVIVDSYYVTPAYLSAIKNEYYTVYLDDIYAFPYPVNCILNYTLNASKARYEALYNGETPELLLGADYVPLRKEFSETAPEKTGKIRNILVSTGGADTEHIALKLINYIKTNNVCGDYRFRFVIGAANADRAEIENAAKGARNIEIYYDIKDMRAFMLSNDAAISASGTTLYELCACALPIVTYTVADNQLDNEKAFCENGIAVSAGDARNNPAFAENLFKTADSLFKNAEKCEALTSKARALINPAGASKAAEKILNLL